MQSAIEISPSFGAGFRAEVKIDDKHLRLFVKAEEEGWNFSVYNVNRRTWISVGGWASDAADAKRRAEYHARYFIPGEYKITWEDIR